MSTEQHRFAGRRVRVALRLVTLATLSFATLACRDSGAGESALERVRVHGLRVGYAIEPPYAFVDSTGEATGEAPEVARYVAQELRIADVEWYPMPFHELVPAVLAGRVDVVASGLFITAERQERVRFSLPTICVQPAMVRRSRVGAGRDPCPECAIAVIQGSVEQRAFEEHEWSGELMTVPDAATGVAAVVGGAADGFVISSPTARSIAERDPELRVDEGVVPRDVAKNAQGCAALAFHPVDEVLAAAVDSVLAKFVGSPEHRALARSFGFTDAELACGARGAARSESVAIACTHPDRE